MNDGVTIVAYGSSAILVRLDASAATATASGAVANALRRSELGRYIEAVPAATTVLVRDRAVSRRVGSLVDEIGEQVATIARDALQHRAEIDDRSPITEIPVAFDGADLGDVAALTERTVDDVIALVSETVFTGAFCGFTAGFCYLSGLPSALHVPRLATPRARVPAGSLAIADRWCAVYPSASPGGWRLLGTTAITVWDVEREPPNLIGPAAKVRFVDRRASVAIRQSVLPSRARSVAGQSHALEIVRPGPLATLQDGGRIGWSHLAVSRAGPADRASAARANRLVGNRVDATTIELTLGGLQLHAQADVTVAIAGAPCAIAVASSGDRSLTRASAYGASRLGMESPATVAAGATITLGPPTRGVRTYLAVRGGIVGGTASDGRAVAPILGSLSTDLLGGVGPPPLLAGTRLAIGDATNGPINVDVAAVAELPNVDRTMFVDVVAFDRDLDLFDELIAGAWMVRAESNRVAVRLDGTELRQLAAADNDLADADRRPPEGLMPGAVQLPPDGLPIVFGVDHPTTGGYRVIGIVTDAGVDRLAQARPGQRVRFRPVRESR